MEILPFIFIFLNLRLSDLKVLPLFSHLFVLYEGSQIEMQELPPPKFSRSKSATQKKGSQCSQQFPTALTLQFEELLRAFNYSYPNKDKDLIINKNLTGYTYWMVIDAFYYSEAIDYEFEKINSFRKKSLLNKNGWFPPTKDVLEEEKFILKLRKMISDDRATLNISQIKSTAIADAIALLETHLRRHEEQLTEKLDLLQDNFKKSKEEEEADLLKFNIPIIKAARLFKYHEFEQQIIADLKQKFKLRENEPKCEMCFNTEKTMQCKSCKFNVHLLCYPKLTRDYPYPDFTCDNCEKSIPQNAECLLCPCLGGYFVEVADEYPSYHYQLQKGESFLKFNIEKKKQEGMKKVYMHMSCFVFNPVCQYNMETKTVQGVHLIDNRKPNNTCSICGNLLGMTVSCYQEGCRKAFHPQCARRNNLSINVIKANNKALLEIYCERHKRQDSFQIFMDSAHNKIRELKKFYDGIDYQMKRNGIIHSQNHKSKKLSKIEQNLKMDHCLTCSTENDYNSPIVNCSKCYGWRHERCQNFCPLCQ